MKTEAFSMRMNVRIYELDPQLHLSGSVYVQYADQARYACLEAAGISVADMLAGGIGPVNLETTIRYHHEIRIGQEIDVTCSWTWGSGKTYRVEHQFLRPDGELAAEVNLVSGLLELDSRKLLRNPAGFWRDRTTRAELLGLQN